MDQTHPLLMIKASAGSGKTYNLALRYIEQLLFHTREDGRLELRSPAQREYHRHILAITFTNKATDEMKRRIINELHTLIRPDGKSDFLPYFERHCTPQAFGKIHEQAAQALSDILFNYASFNVSTIDSFFQTVMRAFARELDRDYNYEVQIDEKYAMQVAVHNFLLSLGNDVRRTGRETEVDRWVKDYIGDQVRQRGDWAFFNKGGGLADFAGIMSKELFRRHMPALRQYLSQDDGNGHRQPSLHRIGQFKQAVVSIAKQCAEQFALLPDEFAHILADNGLSNNTVKGTLKVFLSPMSVDKALTTNFLKINLEKIMAVGASGGCFNKGTKQECVDAAASHIYELKQKATSLQLTHKLLSRLAEELGQLGLIGKIDEKLEEFRRETNSILLADTNDLIDQVLKGGVDFIYERIGTWINHYMIDEFQDTSRKQYENFRPLLHESTARGDDNLALIIGDSKQSIYRFRNADPSLFREQVEKDFKRQVHLESLDTNWRSMGNVVTFNNRLFEAIIAHYGPQSALVGKTYVDHPDDSYKQKVKPSAQDKGLVRIAFNDVDLQPLATSGSDPEVKYTQVLNVLPQYLVMLHERYRWGEIGILVNKNDEANVVVKTLLAHNRRVRETGQGTVINVVSDEAMLIANSACVRRIVSALRFIDLTLYAATEDEDSDDTTDGTTANELMARIMKHRLDEQRRFSLLGDFVDRLSQEDNVDATRAGQLLQQCFDTNRETAGKSQDEQIEEYASLLAEILPNTRNELMNLVNVVEKIIGRYITPNMVGEDNETAYLLAFQDCVAAFAKQHNGGTVCEFLRFWDTKGKSITVGADACSDAVQVMTIHKAKGLEFWCLLIPFASWDMTESTRLAPFFWMTKQDFMSGLGNTLNLDEEMVPPLLPVEKSSAKDMCEYLGRFEQIVKQHTDEVTLEAINKTYVALTRPCYEMHVFAYAKAKNVGQLLKDCIHQVEGMQALTPDEVPLRPDDTAPQPDEPTDWFDFGQMPTREFLASEREKAQIKANATSHETIVSMPSYQVHTPDERVKVRLEKEVEDAQNLGLRLHRLLSLIRNKNDVDYALRYAQAKGLADDNDPILTLERARDIITDMMRQAEPYAWFDPANRVYNEQSLTLTVHDNSIFLRPDRVVRHPDGTLTVIDYKFGEHSDQYPEQVRRYMNALRAAGHRCVKGFLWYPLVHQIEEV